MWNKSARFIASCNIPGHGYDSMRQSKTSHCGALVQGSSIKIVYGATYEQRVIDMKKKRRTPLPCPFIHWEHNECTSGRAHLQHDIIFFCISLDIIWKKMQNLGSTHTYGIWNPPTHSTKEVEEEEEEEVHKWAKQSQLGHLSARLRHHCT